MNLAAVFALLLHGLVKQICCWSFLCAAAELGCCITLQSASVDVAVAFVFQSSHTRSSYCCVFPLIGLSTHVQQGHFFLFVCPPTVTERANHARDHLTTDAQLDKYDGWVPKLPLSVLFPVSGTSQELYYSWAIAPYFTFNPSSFPAFVLAFPYKDLIFLKSFSYSHESWLSTASTVQPIGRLTLVSGLIQTQCLY